QEASPSPLEVSRRALPGAVRVVDPDHQIAAEGEARRRVIGVVSGVVRCFRMTLDGRRHVSRFVYPGGLIGLGALSAFRSSAEAVTTSAIVEFGAGALEACAGANREVAAAIVRAMTSELTARDRVQFRLGSLWADERVADFLLQLADISRAGAGQTIALRMSRTDIADHLGVTIETVSRALRRFQREGVIRLDGPHRFSIVARRVLGALAAGDDAAVGRSCGAARPACLEGAK
ncbi:MAG TPA: helix-turn-helix domain-containing protein, partial [Caulobacterales bacterium]|nr:helix-turn-helix domain-containing protein [Caulobacterales bacterium]